MQYADPSLFVKVLSDFSPNLLAIERARKGKEVITTKNVEQYLIEHQVDEIYAKELLEEFSKIKKYFKEEEQISQAA